MSAPAPAKAPTAAGKFADEAEALGWEVERLREDGNRIVIATRGSESYEVEWRPGSRGLVMVGAMYFPNGDDWASGVPVTNLKAALRDMAKFRTASGALLPFDPENSDDHEILAAVAGRQIEWRNKMSGLIESAFVPRGGLHLKITQGKAGDNGGARVLNFTDPVHTGFRAVYIDQITEVK